MTCGAGPFNSKKTLLCADFPWPWHVWQVSGATPPLEPVPLHSLHCTDVGTRMFVLLPAYAWARVTSILYRRSEPLPDWRAFRRPPPVKASPNISSKISENHQSPQCYRCHPVQRQHGQSGRIRPLFIVRQHVVGLIQLLKFFLQRLRLPGFCPGGISLPVYDRLF